MCIRDSSIISDWSFRFTNQNAPKYPYKFKSTRRHDSTFQTIGTFWLTDYWCGIHPWTAIATPRMNVISPVWILSPFIVHLCYTSVLLLCTRFVHGFLVLGMHEHGKASCLVEALYCTPRDSRTLKSHRTRIHIYWVAWEATRALQHLNVGIQLWSFQDLSLIHISEPTRPY